MSVPRLLVDVREWQRRDPVGRERAGEVDGLAARASRPVLGGHPAEDG